MLEKEKDIVARVERRMYSHITKDCKRVGISVSTYYRYKEKIRKEKVFKERARKLFRDDAKEKLQQEDLA